MKKLSCNLNELIHYRQKLFSYKPSWIEILMVLIFLTVFTNGLYHSYIK